MSDPLTKYYEQQGYEGVQAQMQAAKTERAIGDYPKEPTIPCRLCSSPVSIHNKIRVCSDCELRMHQESQVP
jgi:hypothetical protein